MFEFTVNREKCLQCGHCAADCLAGVIVMTPNGPAVPEENQGRCIGCQHCLAVCKPGALSIFGKDPAKSLVLKSAFPSPAKVAALIKGRRSVRRYKKTAVERETLDVLMEAVSFAPTGVNRRNGGMTLVDDPAVMENIRTYARERVAALLADQGLSGSLAAYEPYFRSWTKENDVVFRGAPHMVIATHHADNPSGPTDAVISLAYFELLARSMGLGALWCGLAKLVLTALVPDLPSRIGVPGNQRVGYVMLFGKPAVNYPRAVQRDPLPVVSAKMD